MAHLWTLIYRQDWLYRQAITFNRPFKPSFPPVILLFSFHLLYWPFSLGNPAELMNSIKLYRSLPYV